jgi:hypothetical protein
MSAGLPCTTPDCGGFFTEFAPEVEDIAKGLYSAGYRIVSVRDNNWKVQIYFAVDYQQWCFPRLYAYGLRYRKHPCALGDVGLMCYEFPAGSIDKVRLWVKRLSAENTAGLEVVLSNLQYDDEDLVMTIYGVKRRCDVKLV